MGGVSVFRPFGLALALKERTDEGVWGRVRLQGATKAVSAAATDDAEACVLSDFPTFRQYRLVFALNERTHEGLLAVEAN